MTKVASPKSVTNRKASFQFELLERFEAGLVLTGSEVKAIREGKANLVDAHVSFRQMEAWVYNMHISHYAPSGQFNHEPLRPRKLLLHKRQLQKLSGQLREKGLALVATKLYFNQAGKAKLEIALARGKKAHDKREAIKSRDAKRDVERALQRKG